MSSCFGCSSCCSPSLASGLLRRPLWRARSFGMGAQQLPVPKLAQRNPSEALRSRGLQSCLVLQQGPGALAGLGWDSRVLALAQRHREMGSMVWFPQAEAGRPWEETGGLHHQLQKLSGLQMLCPPGAEQGARAWTSTVLGKAGHC